MKRLLVAPLLALVLGYPGQSLGDVFRPSDIADLGLWLDAQDPRGTGEPLADGSVISTWTDKSGVGNHATQTVAKRRPTYVRNGLNGRPSMQFDGIDDWFDVPSLFTLDSVTCFIVGQSLPETLTGYDNNSPFIAAFEDRFYIWRSPDTGKGTFMFAMGLDDLYERHYSPGDNAPHIFVLRNDGMENGLEGFVNGSSVGVGTRELGERPDSVQLGAYESGHHLLDGYIAEVLIYNRGLPDAERVAVEGYLADKWCNVPEPSSLVLLGVGGLSLISLTCLRRRQRTRWQ